MGREKKIQPFAHVWCESRLLIRTEEKTLNYCSSKVSK